MTYSALFNSLHPGFFERADIRSLPATRVFSEQILDLRGFSPEAFSLSCPDGITFGMARCPIETVRDAVRRVDPGWTRYFNEGDPIYCAFDGERIASFCIAEDMGRHGGLRVGGPGCVGTVPEYRRRGIGLMMVLKATALLKRQGFDLSYIHYTQVDHWYARLGYETVVRWNRDGIIWTRDGQNVIIEVAPELNELT